MSEKREFTGVFIPAHIWLSKELLPAEKMLLGEIDALSKKTGWCTAGRAHFAEWLHCDETNVTYYIKKLERLGYLMVVRIAGHGNKIRVVTERFYVDEVVNGIHGGSERDSRVGVNGIHGGSERDSPKIQSKYNTKSKGEKRAQAGDEYIAMLEAQNKEIDRAAAAARKAHTLIESIELAEGWIKTNSEELKKWCGLAKYSGTPAELMNDVSKFFSHHRKGKEDVHEVKSNPLRFFEDGFLYWMIDSVKMKNTGASKYTPAQTASSIPANTKIL